MSGTNIALNSLGNGKTVRLVESSHVTPDEFRTILVIFVGVPALIVLFVVLVRYGLCARCER